MAAWERGEESLLLWDYEVTTKLGLSGTWIVLNVMILDRTTL